MRGVSRRRARGIQTAPFSTTPKAPRTMATSVPARSRGSSSSSGLNVAQDAASGRLEAMRLALGYVRRTMDAMRSRMLLDLSSSGVLSPGFVTRFPESSVSADAISSSSSIRMHRAAAALTALSRNSANGSENVMGVKPSGPLSTGAGLLALRASNIVSLLLMS